MNLVAIAAKQLQRNNYVRRGKPSGGYWMDFALAKLDALRTRHGTNFNLIVYGEPSDEKDFYVIPFALVTSMFTEQTMVKPKNGKKRRWIANINGHRFRVNHAGTGIDVAGYYGRPELLDTVRIPRGSDGGTAAARTPGYDTTGHPPMEQKSERTSLPALTRQGIGKDYQRAARMGSDADREESARVLRFDPGKVERGLQGHIDTQNGLADFLEVRGIAPRSPSAEEPDYDVAWAWGNVEYVAEVKSITDGNEDKQLRLALGQVLHYRQQLRRGAKPVVAVLVPERKPSDQIWFELCAEFGVLVAWPGAFERLFDRSVG